MIIRPFALRMNKILPTVYDDSLSYYEQICKLTHKLNELIEYLNSLGDFVTEDQMLEAIKEDSDMHTSREEELRGLIGSLDNMVAMLNAELGRIGTEVKDFDDIVRQAMENAIGTANKYTDDKILGNLVINPFSGRIDTIQNILNTLADLHKTGSLTAQQYDNLLLTAKAYDEKQLTAYQYDFEGEEHLL